MATGPQRREIQRLLDSADIRVDGDRPWDIQIENERFFEVIIPGGSLALGESYVAGWWECEALDVLFDKILTCSLDEKAKTRSLIWKAVKSRLRNPQRSTRAFDIGRFHYDTGNDLFSIMLDKWMNYSCGYWRQADNLEEAQKSKLDLTCRKLNLTPGLRILDIGCGWGGLARFAAEEFGVQVVGITVSREQASFARDFCRGLPVEIRYQDYRELHEKFDRVVSIGMFEHVGLRNYKTYFRVVHRCLQPDGLFLLHTIGRNTSVNEGDPWISKYIFPNYLLPSAQQITSAAEGLFVLEDWHSFGPDYDRTLLAWYQNLAGNWDRLKDRYDNQFFRTWKYYLLCCAGSFRARRNQLWQIVFSKRGIRGQYSSVR